MNKLEPKDFIENKDNLTIIDVRSPKEFEEGHIPGAVSMPLFDNEERAVVGTLYKQKSRQAAILKGLEYVGPKMADFSKQALALAKNNKIKVHCWRGGMRSESMAWLFERVGLEVEILIGGYKAYRQYCASEMSNLSKLLILKGCTGSGKTKILHEMEKLDEQIIDLEGLANHRGSAFGGIGQGEQPTTQQFQNILYEKFSKLDKNKTIWIEGESKSIGKIYIPDTFWESMLNANIIEINVPFEERVKRLVDDYASLDAEEMEHAIMKLERRISNGRMNEILDIYRSKNYEKTASLLLAYYDSTYKYSDKNYTHKINVVKTTTGDAVENAKLLINTIKSLI